MSDLATALPGRPRDAGLLEKKMKKSHALISGAVVLIALITGLGFIGFNVSEDFRNVALGSRWPYLLLVVALLIALGFEFVNGFHDTANAVATVIYTHSLEPNIAVVWSGLMQPGRRPFVVWARGIHCDHPSAGGTYPAGKRGRGLRDGIRVAHSCHPLEPQHLVARPASLKFSHDGRVDHRGWRR